jgi:thiamine monophosphate kinase
LCLSGGEDYEYLFTADDGQPAAGALCIGEVVPEGFLLAGAGGVEKEWPRCGYEHFKV